MDSGSRFILGVFFVALIAAVAVTYNKYIVHESFGFHTDENEFMSALEE